MDEQKRLGGKGNGLVWLVEHQNLGYKVPPFDGIGISHYADIQKQAEIAKLASVIARKPYVAERLQDNALRAALTTSTNTFFFPLMFRKEYQ